MSKAWKTLAKKLEYKNPFLEVWKHDVVRTNGYKSPYYVLRRDPAGSYFSIIVPLVSDSETILVGQYRYPVGFYSWEFPMGHAEGDDFLETAKIELKEETGVSASVWKKIGKFFVAPGFSSEVAVVFIAKDLLFGQPKKSTTETLEVKKTTITKIGEMIKIGKILDGPTIVAYHYLELYLKGKK